MSAIQPSCVAAPPTFSYRSTAAPACAALQADRAGATGAAEDNAREALRRAILSCALRFGDDPVFDFRLLLNHAGRARQAGLLMWQAIRAFAPQVLVGPGFGAAALLCATAAAALDEGIELDILMVRDKRKPYHQKRWVEGPRPPAHSRAVLIDDFMEAGSALGLVDRALAADGLELDLVAIGLFFDMWQPLGSRQISTGRMPVVSLFRRHDIGLSRDCFDARPPLMQGSHPPFIAAKPRWWRFRLNTKTAYPLKCAPVIADEAVFVADDHSRIWRHDGRTGDIAWQADSLADPLKGIVQKLEYAEGSLVFGCYDGTVTRLDAASGAILWRWRIDSSIHATPALDLARQRLFINTEQWNDGDPYGHLQALDWHTGRLLWRCRQRWWPPGSPVHAADANLVVATCNDQTVSAHDADTGALRWHCPTRGLVRGKPAVHEGRLLLATEAGWLQCRDLASGALLWETRYGRGAMHQFLHIHGDTVLVLDGRWHMAGFDVRSGAIRWLSRLRSAGNWCPVACGRFLAVLSREGHLAVFDAEREIKVWEGSTGLHGRQPPAIGTIDGKACLAVAGNAGGLQLYPIDPAYTEVS